MLLKRLVQLFLHEETVRVITAGNAILQKSHMYEVLVDLQQAAAVASSEPQQVDTHTHTHYLQEVKSVFQDNHDSLSFSGRDGGC